MRNIDYENVAWMASTSSKAKQERYVLWIGASGHCKKKYSCTQPTYAYNSNM